MAHVGIRKHPATFANELSKIAAAHSLVDAALLKLPEKKKKKRGSLSLATNLAIFIYPLEGTCPVCTVVPCSCRP